MQFAYELSVTQGKKKTAQFFSNLIEILVYKYI